MSEPWRFTCPDGHHTLRPRRDGAYYCGECGAVHRRVWDKKRSRLCDAQAVTVENVPDP